MGTDDRIQLARDFYRAFAAGDRDFVERALDEEFSFSSPVDVGLDRAGLFERCWPGAGQVVQEFEFVRLLESGEITRPANDGRGTGSISAVTPRDATVRVRRPLDRQWKT